MGKWAARGWRFGWRWRMGSGLLFNLKAWTIHLIQMSSLLRFYSELQNDPIPWWQEFRKWGFPCLWPHPEEPWFPPRAGRIHWRPPAADLPGPMRGLTCVSTLMSFQVGAFSVNFPAAVKVASMYPPPAIWGGVATTLVTRLPWSPTANLPWWG